MPTTDRKLRVFLCHASQDKPVVRELYQRLLAEDWLDPWLDEEKLLPGQDWDMEIEKAVEAADAVIACLSSHSVTKEGYIQKELRFVLNIAERKLEGTIFIIPLRLNPCDIPRRLQMWQYVDCFPDSRVGWAFKRVFESLKSRNDLIKSLDKLRQEDQKEKPTITVRKTKRTSQAKSDVKDASRKQLADDAQLLVNKARMSARKKEYKQAIKYYDRAINLHPENDQLYFARAELYFKKKNFSKALKDAIHAIIIDPKKPEYHMLCGKLYLDKHLLREAVECCDNAIKIVPDNPEYHIFRAQINSLERRRYPSAYTDYGKALALEPQRLDLYVKRAKLFLTDQNTQNLEKAVADLSKAIQLEPEKIEHYSLRSSAYEKIGDFVSAHADYSKLSSLDPKNLTKYLKKQAWMSERAGLLNQAVREYDRLISLSPTDSEHYIGRGDIYLKQNQFDRTIADYEHAIGLNRSLFYKLRDLLLKRISQSDELGNFETVISHYSRIINFEPISQNYQKRAETYLKMNNFDGALADFRGAVERESYRIYEIRTSLESIAVQSKLDGDINKAIKIYSLLINLEPNRKEGYKARIELYIRMNEYTKAIADYDRLINIDPIYKPNYFFEKAKLELARGNIYQAKSDFQMAKNLGNLSARAELERLSNTS